MGTGVCITPGSAGNALMNLIWQQEQLKKQTCVSASCEIYLRKNSVGGIINTLQNGEYNEGLKFDSASNYLAHFVVEPTGAPVWFNSERTDLYKTYFAECSIKINETLPMGVFPIRGRAGRIFYPTLEGSYNGIHLWKEQVEFCRQQGLQVSISGGCGWQELTSDPWHWSECIYWKRKKSPNALVEHFCKSAAVGAIGRHGMQRLHYSLAPDDKESLTSIVIVNKEGEPLCYRVVDEPSERSAYLLHWQRYTVGMANLTSLKFAMPFAQDSRLIQIYHDSCIVLEKDEKKTYIARHSNESLTMPPGTWLWEMLSPLKVDKKGNIDSPQYKRGVVHA
jgi:hypothetical protein